MARIERSDTVELAKTPRGRDGKRRRPVSPLRIPASLASPPLVESPPTLAALPTAFDLNGHSVTARSLEKVREIGRGRYGTVDLMRVPNSKVTMAVKRIRESSESQELKYLDREVRACLSAGSCPFLVHCYGVMRLEGDVWICMEVMDASLDRFYQICEDNKQQLPHFLLARIAHSMVSGLQFLAENLKLMHRDVKPSNCLIDRDGRVKLCDYGVSGVLESNPMQKTINAGHKAYMAPERIAQQHEAYRNYDERSDVWSLGISLYEIGSGEHPYDKWKNPFEQLKQVVYQPAPALAPADPRFHDEFKDFVHGCLQKDYDLRPRYSDLLRHPLIANFLAKEVELEPRIVAFVRRILELMEETVAGLAEISVSKPSFIEALSAKYPPPD